MPDDEYEELLTQNHERVCYVPEPPTPEPAPESDTAAEAPETAETTPEPQHAGHRAIQEEIAVKAKKHGFVANVEYVLPNDKRVDVALFGHGLRIAVEVSVTNRQEYELSNVEKALEAGFNVIWMVAPDEGHRGQLKQFVRDKLPPDKWASVLFGAAGDVEGWLERYKAPQRNIKQIAGYEIAVSIATPPNTHDHQHRHSQLESLLQN